MDQSDSPVDYSYDLEEDTSSTNLTHVVIGTALAAGIGYVALKGWKKVRYYLIDRKIDAAVATATAINTTSTEVK